MGTKKIKRLAFRKGRAWTPFGDYEVAEFIDDELEGKWYATFSNELSIYDENHNNIFNSKEEAQIAAQLDFEKRVMTCLSKD